MSIAEQKKRVRRDMRRLLKTQDPSELASRSGALVTQLLKHPKVQEARTVLSYWSLPSEVPTHDLNHTLVKNKRVLLPVIDGDELYLSPFEPKASLKTESIYGIAEPTGQAFSAYDEVDLVLVPGLAFAPNGGRCGKGKGYYDKTLSKLQNAYTIGLGFDFQLIESVPMDAHDHFLNEIVTV